MSKTRFTPIFVGRTEEGKKVVLYKGVDNVKHIRIDDGELWALSPGSELTTWEELEPNQYHLMVTSTVWSGKATGSRSDIIDEPTI